MWRVDRRHGAGLIPLAVLAVLAAACAQDVPSDASPAPTARPAAAADAAPAADVATISGDGRPLVPCLSIRVEGRLFRCPDGTPFRWRGVTGFRLVADVAAGRETRAERYLDWARATGFTVVRVLTTETILFDLAPDAGRAALPRALALARDRGLILSVVAISDSAERAFDVRRHARLVAEACARAGNCVFEFANEPGHPSQIVELHDAAVVDRLAAEATGGLDLPWTAGPSWASDVETAPAGRFVTRHLERAGTGWAQAGRVAELAALGAALDKPVVSNEPIGFDEEDGARTGRQRIADCDVALAFGVLSRVLEVGTTFHLQAGLQDDEPGPVQQRCAAAFIDGTRILPDAITLTAALAGTPDSPLPAPAPVENGWRVAGVSDRAAIAVEGGRPAGAPPAWRGGWTMDALVVDRPELRVWRLTRGTSSSGGPHD
ncbi:MAG: hypothetical protein R2752_18520 [Vicinamibacterales bacterium]